MSLVLKSQLAEYKRQPLLNLGFILSLAIATSTLLSILMLNHASKQEYKQANSLLKNPIAYNIVAKQGAELTKQDYIYLRKQGFTQIQPILAFRKTLSNGNRISFKAIDLLAISILQQEMNANRVLLSQTYLDSLNLDNKDISASQIRLAEQQLTTFGVIKENQFGNSALLDLTLAWQLFPEEGDYSYLIVSELNAQSKFALEAALPEHLTLFQPWSIEERSGFADALHLNLNALALLGFIVCMFIAFQAGNQAWEKRANLAAQLRLLGVQLLSIKIALLVETLFLVFTASVLGVFFAVILVSFLLPLLGLTLQQLYSLNSSMHFQWQWLYFLWAVIISGIAVVLALIKQFKHISTKNIALSAKQRNERFPSWQLLWLSVFLMLLFLFWPDHNWLQIMVKYACLLMASVAFLPIFLQLLIFLAGYSINYFRLTYLFKDARKQVIRRYLPLAAFYLAITASTSAALMVNSFESAFINYLDQQLNADIFIRHKPWQKNTIANWLNKQNEVEAYFISQGTWAKVTNESVKVSSYESTRQLDTLLLKSAVNDAQPACYINEQLALKQAISLGQSLLLEQQGRNYECNINGIYYQYGYPGYSAIVDHNVASDSLTGWAGGNFSIYFKPGQLIEEKQLSMELGLDDQQVYVSQQIKKLALNIFSQTFVLIQTIAAVLLMI
ncbi:MAG: ABC transporter permease, partial [Psychromonas sp.]